MVDFENAVTILAKQLGAIQKEKTEEHAFIMYEKREIAFTRLPKLERHITAFYPTLSPIAYISNQIKKSRQEVEVWIALDERMYIVNIELVHLERAELHMKVFEVTKNERTNKWFITASPGMKRLVDRAYPELTTLMLTYIQTMPSYRLHFITQQITLKHFDESHLI